MLLILLLTPNPLLLEAIWLYFTSSLALHYTFPISVANYQIHSFYEQIPKFLYFHLVSKSKGPM